MAKLGMGSRLGYKGAWKQWSLFCRARDRDPYLLGRTAIEDRADEELLLDFITHLARWMHRTAGTIQTKLMGVRYHHLAAGLKDPLKDKGRVWLELGGIRRVHGSKPRKWPMTVQLMRWCMHHSGQESSPDDAYVVYAAAGTAWFFALRGHRCSGTDLATGAHPHRPGCHSALERRKDPTFR